MKTTNGSNRVRISFEDFHKLILNGSVGHNLIMHSANSYVSQVKFVISQYQIEEREFLKFIPCDILTLMELINEDQRKNETFNANTFNAIISALKCYYNYLNYKYNGVTITRRKVSKPKNSRFICQNHKCKSLLWKLLNAFGLLKYI